MLLAIVVSVPMPLLRRRVLLRLPLLLQCMLSFTTTKAPE